MKMAIIQKALGEVGAGINALNVICFHYASNTDAAASRILDVDFAKESSILAKVAF